jgi:tetratricopeptide (TPR) repeat protein
MVQQPAVVEVQQPGDVPPQASLAAPVDYAQPLNTGEPPPDPATADPAIQTFDAGRAAFKEGNYALALQKTDEALKSLPTDAAIHEFRALCLFALKQYEQAAGTLYAVLSAGPGWDWTTLIGLYPSVDVYTEQLRALEDFRAAHLDSAPARFVLAYHYLTQGHTENAVEELKELVKLQPSDQLSTQLIAQLSGGGAGAGGEAAAPQPPQSPAPPAEKLIGNWTASPAPGTTIALTLGGDAKFRWDVQSQGKSQPIEGSYTYENGVLTLSQSDANALVGKVAMTDDGKFTFQAMGGGAGDPGLVFSR